VQIFTVGTVVLVAALPLRVNEPALAGALLIIVLVPANNSNYREQQSFRFEDLKFSGLEDLLGWFGPRMENSSWRRRPAALSLAKILSGREINACKAEHCIAIVLEHGGLSRANAGQNRREPQHGANFLRQCELATDFS